MEPIQIFLISAIVFIIVGIVMFLITNRGGGASAKQKSQIELIRGGQEIRSNEKDMQNKRRAEIARKLKTSKDEEHKSDKKKVTIATKLGQAGLSITVRQFWLYSLLSCAAFLGMRSQTSVALSWRMDSQKFHSSGVAKVRGVGCFNGLPPMSGLGLPRRSAAP